MNLFFSPSGIGKATAEDLARRNARVIMACRNTPKASRVAEEIITRTGNDNVIVKYLDLASLKTVRKCAEDILNTEEKLDVLINNAGIFSNLLFIYLSCLKFVNYYTVIKLPCIAGFLNRCFYFFHEYYKFLQKDCFVNNHQFINLQAW